MTEPAILVPPTVWMGLRCETPDERDITKMTRTTVLFMPPCPYKTHYETDRYIFTPIIQPDPAWVIPRNFIVGSFVLTAYNDWPLTPGASTIFEWDIAGQEDYRAGEVVAAGTCSVMR